MSNSSLVTYTKISPNKSKRTKAISKITIHHMAANATVERCAAEFANPEREASSNYGVGSDGRIGMYVEEKDMSWASSSAANDNVAVTIEVANDKIGGDWHVSDKALASLIDLCADICVRNGIERLNFTGDKNGNLTMHNYFIATTCPGPYLESKFPYIANEVNKRLSAKKAVKLESGNDIVWELMNGKHKIEISEVQRAVKALDKAKSNPEFASLYWILYKLVNGNG